MGCMHCVRCRWEELFCPADFRLPSTHKFSGIYSSQDVSRLVGATSTRTRSSTGVRASWGRMASHVQNVLDERLHFDGVMGLESPHGAIHVYCGGPMRAVPWAGRAA